MNLTQKAQENAHVRTWCLVLSASVEGGPGRAENEALTCGGTVEAVAARLENGTLKHSARK